MKKLRIRLGAFDLEAEELSAGLALVLVVALALGGAVLVLAGLWG